MLIDAGIMVYLGRQALRAQPAIVAVTTADALESPSV
jgi:hypothetical protein